MTDTTTWPNPPKARALLEIRVMGCEWDLPPAYDTFVDNKLQTESFWLPWPIEAVLPEGGELQCGGLAMIEAAFVIEKVVTYYLRETGIETVMSVDHRTTITIRHLLLFAEQGFCTDGKKPIAQLLAEAGLACTVAEYNASQESVPGVGSTAP